MITSSKPQLGNIHGSDKLDFGDKQNSQTAKAKIQ